MDPQKEIMEIIVRRGKHNEGIREEYTEENREYRKKFHETREEFERADIKDLAVRRRFAIKKSRFQDKSPKSIAEAAAFRDLMENQING